jgi:hypothetical protein
VGLFSKAKEMQAQAQQAVQNAGGVSGTAQGMGNIGGQAAYAQKANKIGQQGIEAPGVLHAIRPSGQTEFGGGQMVSFDVTITPAGGQPYDATIEQSMLPAQLEGIAEGGAITVKYDPDDSSQALMYGW